MVDRIKISSNGIEIRNASDEVTFSTSRAYLISGSSGSFKLSGFEENNAFLGRSDRSIISVSFGEPIHIGTQTINKNVGVAPYDLLVRTIPFDNLKTIYRDWYYNTSDYWTGGSNSWVMEILQSNLMDFYLRNTVEGEQVAGTFKWRGFRVTGSYQANSTNLNKAYIYPWVQSTAVSTNIGGVLKFPAVDINQITDLGGAALPITSVTSATGFLSASKQPRSLTLRIA